MYQYRVVFSKNRFGYGLLLWADSIAEAVSKAKQMTQGCKIESIREV